VTRADRLLIVVLAVVALLAWPLAASAGSAGARVEITGPDGFTGVSLADEASLVVAGSSGEVLVEVSGDHVRVAEADCPDQVCVRTGAVAAAGSVIACVPNGVVVRVTGGESDGFDARIR
jgi:hypothetical protein